MAKSEEVSAIPLQWRDIDELPALYANQVLVSYASGNEFYIVFGEVEQPLAALARGETVEHVEIRPVAKIVMSPPAMQRAAAAMYSCTSAQYK